MSKSPNSNKDIENRTPSTPRWVKVLGIIALVLILLMAILHLTGVQGPGNHGPGQHVPARDDH